MTEVNRYWLNSKLAEAEAASFKGKTFRLTMLDVGPGEAIFLEDGRKAALIDGGSGEEKENKDLADKLLTYIEKRKLSVEMFIASHPHQDHLNALPILLRKLKQAGKLAQDAKFYHNGKHLKGMPKELLEQVNQMKPLLTPLVPKPDITDDLNSKTAIHLFMDEESSHGPDYESVIARVTYGEASIILTGDIYTDYEKNLVKDNAHRLKAQVLKITHHGSYGGTGEDFLKAVRPQIAIASTALKDGKEDPGHNIDKATSDRLKKEKVKVFETAQQGTIIIRTDGIKRQKGVLFEVSTAKKIVDYP